MYTYYVRRWYFRERFGHEFATLSRSCSAFCITEHTEKVASIMGVQVPELKQCVAFVFSSRVLVSRRECLLLLLLLLLQSDCAFFREMRNFCAVERRDVSSLPFERQNELTRAPFSLVHSRGTDTWTKN